MSLLLAVAIKKIPNNTAGILRICPRFIPYSAIRLTSCSIKCSLKYSSKNRIQKTVLKKNPNRKPRFLPKSVFQYIHIIIPKMMK